ncbi:metal-dependent hydrolase [Haloterrigena alkaliphila]|uniref:Metal-dependent hydrolase n=1 Tax=Haloterrigena alkaliphila TaxID=2816475 RepID=A0A8A2VB24_9EURY|nr:metal-dependent hydrolase [Haloterrigena alkaliphila]QSW97664.1 metal-dependent hydrolase [Haloterrigena alkaliphila]
MMATTHALWGMLLALPVLVLAPEHAPTAVAAGLVGGLVPDFDLYAGHRKTFHYPVYASTATVPAVAAALVSPTTTTVALAVGLAAAALHAVTDAAGGGLELRPWQGRSERAVYSHYHGHWIRPRRWVRYDGAPEDLALAGVAAVPLIIVADGPVTTFAAAMLAVSAVYVLLRKPLATLAASLAGRAPRPIAPYLPERYRET